MSDQPEHTIDANYFIYWEQRALTAERKHTEALAEIERLRVVELRALTFLNEQTDNNAAALRAALEDKLCAEIELQRTTIADTMSDLAKAEAEIERLHAIILVLLDVAERLAPAQNSLARAQIDKARAAALQRIDGINDNPACFNPMIDEVLRAALEPKP